MYYTKLQIATPGVAICNLAIQNSHVEGTLIPLSMYSIKLAECAVSIALMLVNLYEHLPPESQPHGQPCS